jgi:hypothetical protein
VIPSPTPQLKSSYLLPLCLIHSAHVSILHTISFFQSQTFIVTSSPPDAMRVPSGLSATERTASERPPFDVATHCCFSRSQTFTVWSSDGAKRHRGYLFRMFFKLHQAFPSFGVPQRYSDTYWILCSLLRLLQKQSVFHHRLGEKSLAAGFSSLSPTLRVLTPIFS